MILALSIRFKRYIALLLCCTLYSQLLLAAEQLHWSHWQPEDHPATVRDVPYFRSESDRLPGRSSKHPQISLLSMEPDSNVRPASNREPLSRVSASPAFRLPPAPLSANANRRPTIAGIERTASDAIGGPTQPESQSFKSVNDNNMVDVFTGDFSYNIPLLDVGGYPISISYHSGRSMDEDASWVGLGWNINPGSITREMRGLPDDFSGGNDTVKKVSSIKPNISWGLNYSAGGELTGLPLNISAGLGIFHTTYNGWGLETTLNASLNAGVKSAGTLSGGLSLTDNSQNGLTVTPSLSYTYNYTNNTTIGDPSLGLQLASPYNSRTGLKDIQLNLTSTITRHDEYTKDQGNTYHPFSNDVSNSPVGISFSWPSYTPTISMPMTNFNHTYTVKLGGAIYVLHPNEYLSAYYGKEYVAPADTTLLLPAYGYLNFQHRGDAWGSLTDFNREKELPYRETPPVPHIAIPQYTYDVFSMSGEGNVGMFRAYRGDIGFIADHLISSKTSTDVTSLDLGLGDMVHAGVDLNANYSTTQSGPWLAGNPLRNIINFQQASGLFEAAYFRNPAEKTINTTSFFNAIGGDNVATVALSQNGSSITTTNHLMLYNGEKQVGLDTLTSANVLKSTRDKRAQVITYLTAAEASVSGLDRTINNYTLNQFAHSCQVDTIPGIPGFGTGLIGYYYNNEDLSGPPADTVADTTVFFNWQDGSPFNYSSNIGIEQTNIQFPNTHFSVRWLGRLQAPESGAYTFGFWVDDGMRLWIDDSLEINDWHIHGNTWDTCRVNLVAGKMYNIRLEYFQERNGDFLEWNWLTPDSQYLNSSFNHNSYFRIPKRCLYPPLFTDSTVVNPTLTQENRVNGFRKANHISEIDVLNPDGRRYVYGVPVYNLIQKEVSFSVNSGSGNIQTGLTGYSPQDNSTRNTEGRDGYYSREEMPAYAHSFLLTGILSPDYVDVTGDGISDDDLGDAIKFSYTKTAGIANPFGWRAPYITDSVNYNEGFRSYNRDDKGNYIYGTKELWYLHTIESKTMIATFTLQPRADLLDIDENGYKTSTGKAMCLKKIDLYSKADYLKNGALATPIKTIHFCYSYSLCRGINQPVNDSGKLTLTEIWFEYNGNSKGALNPYFFNYHPNNPNYKVNSSDKWNTYKDASQNPLATTSNPITNAEYPYALQDSATAANNAGAWALDSIRLPSGGRIKVNYESDDYAYVQNRRATQLFNVVGIGTDNSGHYFNQLYNFLIPNDPLYIYLRVPYTPASNADLYARYLDGISKLYFRMYVQMPKDDFGSGSEYIPCYADPDTTAASWYGSVSGTNVIWIKVAGVNASADGSGSYNPLAETAINFLRLNLPDKAFPGSEVNDNLTVVDGINILLSQIANITELMAGFTNTARSYGWACFFDTTRTFARLDCPILKKYGGGSRVKSILIYDNWNAMTNQKETVYGQTYDYTTTQSVNGVATTISSGVASWEPAIGGEENPFHLPIEYVQKASILGPAALQYTEEPLGESFYPGPSIGYSRVRVQSIHTTGTRSANGWTESDFYTAYDFPTSWDYSQLDNNTKKRYKPLLQNFLRINAVNYLTLSQGFKVELNDMNGRQRREASYSQTDSVNPISYTEYFYKVDNQLVQSKHLNNCVTTIDPYGNINRNSTIGKDAELMADSREQTTNSTGANINLNTDMFAAGILPIVIPSLLDLYQHETDQFRSVALTKIIQRYGILDSVVHFDRGSKVYTKNLMYDAETGEALLTRTQNEFNDSIFQFSYPSHWAYPGTGPAYWNVGATLSHLTVQNGKITTGLPPSTYAYTYLSPGDEILASSKQTLSAINCNSNLYASFPDSFRLWVVDTNTIIGITDTLFLMDQYGTPFSGNDVTLKVTRSGHRNEGSPIGTVTSLGNPLMADSLGVYHLVFDTTRKVVNASANVLRQFWRVSDKRRSNILTSCVFTPQDSALAASENCSCLQPFFDSLISRHLLYPVGYPKTVGAMAALAGVSISSCPLLNNNVGGFYGLYNPGPGSNIYTVLLGGVVLDLRNLSGLPLNLYSLTSSTCSGAGPVVFKNPGLVSPAPDTVTVNIYPTDAVNLFSWLGNSCPGYVDTLLWTDSASDHLLVENSLSVTGREQNAVGIFSFGRWEYQVPQNPTILSANLILTADTRGQYHPTWPNANSKNPGDTTGVSLVSPAGYFANQPLDTMLYQAYYTPYFKGQANDTTVQNLNVNVTDYVTGYLRGLYYSSNFVLTQGSGRLHSSHYDSSLVAMEAVPEYLTGGYGNYYSTYYNQRYSDTTKWPVLQVKYVYTPFVDTMGAVLEYNSTLSCSTVYGRSCYSAITDTLVNPYKYGLLGNYRQLASYIYYNRRIESSPLQATNIRVNGVINNFAPFWTLQSGQWVPSTDTSRWVWNSQTTLYNRKGFEVENTDPLGRYNSGIYGYDLTLPVAVIQNSRYQESAFEGFEDYGFTSNSCDTTCAEARPFDFSAYTSNISDSAAHTGLYSLRITQDSSISLVDLPVVSAPDPATPGLSDTTNTDTCGTHFDGIKASATSVLPPFKPFAGRQMLVGAWVKEEDSCSCQTYSQDHILLNFSLSGGGTSSLSLLPSGNLIEGWQRYEGIITIPSNAVSMTLTLQASPSSVTYFDDIRIHPFNAEMKSYVYNATNLRLMAELDENNYATFYEYDDDGTLIRVKKETERGIQTIKETRNALLKNQ